MRGPKLRFKSYTDEWVTEKLGAVCSFSKGKELAKADLSNEGKSCILYGELYTKYGAVIDQVYSKTARESNSLVIANKYDVLIPSSGETAIDIACASSLEVDSVLIGGDLNILTPKENIHGHFLSYQINGKRKEKLSTLAQGATVTHLYPDSIQKLECYFPSFEEQKDIANFIQKFDKKIRLQQEKIDLLKEQKKGFMQKKFKLVNNSKEVNLEDLVSEIKAGKSKQASDLDTTLLYPVIGSTGIISYTDTYDYEGDYILIARVGANAGKLSTFNGKCKITDNTIFFECKKIFKEVLVEYLLLQNLNKIAFGSGQPLVKASELKKIKVSVPSENEQMQIKKITNLFSRKIQLELDKLSNLILQKQAFMQQMFI